MAIKKEKKQAIETYGHFNDQDEYVIVRPDTPKPWINYLSNAQYHALVSQTGGGYSYYRDSKLHRILEWQGYKSDRPGRYIFMKDQESQQVWTPNWQPFCQPLDQWQATHGFGYTSIMATHHEIQSEITYFVPPDDPCEVWMLKVKNLSQQDRHLTLVPFVQWVLGDFYLEVDHKNIMTLYNEGLYDKQRNAIIAFKHPSSARKQETYGFFASSHTPRGYELNYENFVGKYGTITDPHILKGKTTFSNQPLRGEEMIGAFEIPITLRAQEEQTLVFVLGFTEKREDVFQIIDRHADPERAVRQLQETKMYWKNKLGGIEIKTPDKNFNRLNNTWGKYQLLNITRWRSASFYVPGEGGRGYRDTAQDVEGAVAVDPALSREWIEKLLKFQYHSGHAVAGYSDIEGPWEIGTDQGILGKGDVAVWIPFMVSAYVCETGDVSFLDHRLPYLDKGTGTVWEHCLKAIDYFWKSRGGHGLPLFWKADWNDALDQCGILGKGESVWLAMAYCRALREMESLAIHREEHDLARQMRKQYEEMAHIINDIAWDGDWFVRAFADSGKVIGSKKSKEGKIYLNAQSWAVLSGVASELRAAKCLKAVEAHLETEIGPALFAPAYQKYDPEIGRITSFAPGTKENAAIFSHAAAFLVVAYAMLKKGKKAFELFSKIAPYHPKKTIERYQLEPYIYSEYCYGPSNQQFGLGAFSWNTGTVTWMFSAATKWILGIRATLEGLMIDPCIPSHWDEYSVVRPFRGAIYHIHVRNPHHVESGVKEIYVNGKKIKGNVIPLQKEGSTCEIEVVMG